MYVDDEEEEDLTDEDRSHGSDSITAEAAKQVPNPNLVGLDLTVVSIAKKNIYISYFLVILKF